MILCIQNCDIERMFFLFLKCGDIKMVIWIMVYKKVTSFDHNNFLILLSSNEIISKLFSDII